MREIPASLRERSLLLGVHALQSLSWLIPIGIVGLCFGVATLLVRDVSPWIAGGVFLAGLALQLHLIERSLPWTLKARDAMLCLKGERIVAAAQRDGRAPFVAIHSFSDAASWHVEYRTNWLARMRGVPVSDADRYPTASGGSKYTLNLIAQVQQAVADLGRTVIIGPNARIAALDVPVIRLIVDDERWPHIAALALGAARAIVLFPGNSWGLAWELGLIRRLGLHAKTIVVMRPAANDFEFLEHDRAASRDAWTQLQRELPDLHLPDYDPMGLVYIPKADFSIGHGVSLNGEDDARSLRRALDELLSIASGASKSLATLLHSVSAAGARVAALNYVDTAEVAARQEGGDLFHQVTLTLEEALEGVERTVDVLGHRFAVRIPPGVRTNMQMRIGKDSRQDGKGDDDIYVVVRVLPHDVYWQEGDDLYCVIRVSGPETGTEIEIPALGARPAMRLRVPAKTKPGSTFRLKGKGAKYRQHVGDLYVTVEQAEGSVEKGTS